MTTTDEDAWQPWLRALRPFPREHHARAVVVAAHPDDETLGVSGLVQDLHADGTAVDLVVATDGEAAFPELSTEDRRALGRCRRAELAESLSAQGLADVRVHWLGLPDSGLAAHRDELILFLTDLLSDVDVCLAPWPGDPHPDHATAGEAAIAAAPATTHCWSYPIWMWHWMDPGDPAIPQAFRHELDRARRERKAAGLAAFVSQLKPGPNGEQPILEPDMLRHFDRDAEVLFRQPPARSAPLSRFAELYAAQADPWDVTGKWYERRKLAVAMASLPAQRYERAVEPACGIGSVTVALASRCDRVVAFDAVPAATAAARARTEGLRNVEIRDGRLPDDFPAGPADLVVFSEILYYLDDADLAATVDNAVDALRPGGHLLAVHWLPWAAEAPRDGMAAHRYLIEHAAFEPLVAHVDEQFALHVLARR